MRRNLLFLTATLALVTACVEPTDESKRSEPLTSDQVGAAFTEAMAASDVQDDEAIHSEAGLAAALDELGVESVDEIPALVGAKDWEDALRIAEELDVWAHLHGEATAVADDGQPAPPPLPTLSIWSVISQIMCYFAQLQANLACCIGAPEGVETDYVTVYTNCECDPPNPNTGLIEDCWPTEPDDIECVHAADLGSGMSEEEVDQPSCQDALELATTWCQLAQGLEDDEAPEITLVCMDWETDGGVGPAAGEVGGAYPICEGLEEFAANGQNCDDLFQRYIPLLPPWEIEIIEEESYTADPSSTGWYGEPDTDQPGTVEIEQPPSMLDPVFANEPVKSLRIEIPGNFVRYQLAHSALYKAIDDMNELEGFECDADELACSINPLTTDDYSDLLKENIENSTDIEVNVTPIDRGYDFTDWHWEWLNGYIDIVADFMGSLKIETIRDMGFNFRDRSRLTQTPIHDPKDENGHDTNLYRLDAKGTYLDRALLVVNLSDDDCAALEAFKYKGDFQLNGKYYTFANSYKCACGEGDDHVNYCVADAFPEKASILNDHVPWPDFPSVDDPVISGDGAERRYVYCSAKDDQQAIWLDVNTVETASTTNVTTETVLSQLPFFDSLMSQHAEWEAVFPQLRSDVIEFACNGRYARRLAAGDQELVYVGKVMAYKGKKVSSAAAISAGTMVTLPLVRGLLAAEDLGSYKVNFKMGVEAKKWFKKWGWIGSLLKRAFKKILKTFSTLASLTVETIGIFVEGQSWVDFGPEQLLVQPILSHRSLIDGDMVRPEIEVGVRRIATSEIKVKVIPLDPTPNWAGFPDECNFNEWDDWKDWVQALISCPIALAKQSAKAALQPLIGLFKTVTNLIVQVLTNLDELVSNTLNGFVGDLSEDHLVARLLESTTQTVTLLPYFYAGTGDPADGPALLGFDPSVGSMEIDEQTGTVVGQIPPPFSSSALLSPASRGATVLSRSFLGSLANINIIGEHKVDFLRMGSKTHYRSMADFGGETYAPLTEDDYESEGLSWHYPPVRFCVSRDKPNGTTAYNNQLMQPISDTVLSGNNILNLDGTALVDQMTDLDEIDTTTSDSITDWRTQCATFADLEVKAHYWFRAVLPKTGKAYRAEVGVLPTRRTNYLLNEVFVCKNDLYCTPVGDIPEDDTSGQLPNDIRERARLATCSVAGDVWFRFCDTGGCTAADPWQNLITSGPYSSAMVNLLINYLAHKAGFPGASQPIIDALEYVDTCEDRLAEYGFTPLI